MPEMDAPPQLTWHTSLGIYFLLNGAIYHVNLTASSAAGAPAVVVGGLLSPTQGSPSTHVCSRTCLPCTPVGGSSSVFKVCSSPQPDHRFRVF
jgi:hypothetical protein